MIVLNVSIVFFWKNHRFFCHAQNEGSSFSSLFLPSHCQSIQTIQTMLVFEGLTMTQPAEKSICVCHRFCCDQEQDLESRQIHCESCWTKKAMISVIHYDQTMLVEPFCCEGIFPKKQNAKQDPLRSLLLHFCKSIFRASFPTNHPHHSSPVPEDLLHSCFSHLLCQTFIIYLLCFSSP